ncbi:MAG: hypothetical protein AUK54_04545 [Helicobacteraceae bacterium CG2_30_36_10]|nr:MAG: hypothetical protein AUK54_04545 [Helicobacteraceae bacterium CG2_30_36_10]
MNKTNSYTSKTRLLFFLFLTLFLVLIAEGFYLSIFKSMSNERAIKKINFVKLSTLPDLAIATEASYVRHRSLADLFCIYKDDGSLREYFPSTYAISHSHILNPHAKKKINKEQINEK